MGQARSLIFIKNKDNKMQYIPQAPPFVMIGQLISSDEKETKTEFLIQEGNIFVEDGVFLEAGLIENMAQTAAAGMGYKSSRDNQDPAIGFIGQIKNLNIKELPKIGQTISTSMRTIHQVMNAFIVEGSIQCGEKLIATAEYKIFLQ